MYTMHDAPSDRDYLEQFNPWGPDPEEPEGDTMDRLALPESEGHIDRDAGDDWIDNIEPEPEDARFPNLNLADHLWDLATSINAQRAREIRAEVAHEKEVA